MTGSTARCFGFVLALTAVLLIASPGFGKKVPLYRADYLQVISPTFVVAKGGWFDREYGLRLFGVDLPLFNARRMCTMNASRYEALSSGAMRALMTLLNNPPIYIRFIGEEPIATMDDGKVSSFLVVLYDSTRKINLNLELVREGYLCAYPRYLEPYWSAMLEAKRKKKGLWKVDYELMECICESR